jgi:C4-type Zn-finger protein
MDKYCAECKSKKITKKMEDYEFPYGIGEDQVTLVSYIPIYSCDSCGFQFIDFEATEIMDKDVQKYKNKNL